MARQAAFVLVASDHGSLIVNRNDFKQESAVSAVGVGIELLATSAYQRDEIDMTVGLLELRRNYFGPGVVAIDGGANIGVHTVEWAKSMSEWGQVLALEPQERLFYALAGNIVLNNCFNACALNSALGDLDGNWKMPVPDYTRPANFGGLELRETDHTPIIGQEIKDYATVRILRIDSLMLGRVDLIKLDIEGMELAALRGAAKTIADQHPLLLVEHGKSGVEPLVDFVRGHDYEAFRFGGNLICAHRLDKSLDHVRHLHKTLLRRQAECDDFKWEWQNFPRPAELSA